MYTYQNIKMYIVKKSTFHLSNYTLIKLVVEKKKKAKVITFTAIT
jgi:hypothetical protein